MKTKVLVVLLGICALFLTGCSIQERIGLVIDEEENVSINMLIAYDNEMIDLSIPSEATEEEVTEEVVHTDEERWAYLETEIKDKFPGYTTEKYEEGEFKGYTIKKDLGKFEEITPATIFAGTLGDDKLSEQKEFFVKKGNEYTIHMDASNVSLGDTAEESEVVAEENTETIPETDELSAELGEVASTAMEDAIVYELSITIPYKAKSHNASTVSADGLTYTWNLIEAESVDLVYEAPKAEETAEIVPVEVKVEEIKPVETTTPTIVWTKASDWAIDELTEANNMELIPELFNKTDLTKDITRKEFAHIAVKLYEKITGNAAIAVASNPFTDTNDQEVLKALNIGITNGTSDTTFEPDALITREQMATMMTRALSKAGIDTKVDLNTAAKFADDDKMNDWSREAIYYMSKIDVIKGVGNNLFDVTGKATVEQALLISERSAAKLAK